MCKENRISEEYHWIMCPVCNNKTRNKIREDTVLMNFPLYCPKCKQETLINLRQFHISVIKEPDAEPIARLKYSGYRLFSFGRRFYYATCHYANIIELVKKSLTNTMEISAYEYELSMHYIHLYKSYYSNAYVVLCCMGVCCNSPLLGRKGGDEK